MSVSRRAVCAASLAALAPVSARADRRLITGVNLAGLEFGSSRLPGEANRDFVAATVADLDYYRSRGAKAVRLPFLWERLQPNLGADLNPQHWHVIEGLIDEAGARSMHVVLDAHQYGRRQVQGRAEIIGESAGVRAEHYATFWSAVAVRVNQFDHVVLNLTNEPHDQDTAQLVRLQNTTIEAIRAAGSSNLVLVSGNAWSGAHSWVSSGNASAMLDIVDPGNRFGFDVHQYLDGDSSGRAATCVNGSGERLASFTNWAREHGKLGFLGEFGAGPASSCEMELQALLEHIAANRDVWIGWTYWAGGAWWDDEYPLSVQPASLSNPTDRPQMSVLRRFFE